MSERTPHHRSARAVEATLAIGLAFLLSFLYFGFRSRFPVPYFDDWAWLASLQGPAPFSRGLWQLHNEHLIVVPRLLVWLDYWTWGWPARISFAAGVASHMALAWVVIDAARRRMDTDTARLLTGAILVLTFFTYELQGVVFPASVLFPLVGGFAALGFWMLSAASRSASKRARLCQLTLAGLASTGAALCLTNGLVVPFIAAALSWQLRLSRRVTIALLALGVAGIALRCGIGGVPQSAFGMAPSSILTFGLAFLGGFVAAVSAPLAVAVGVMSLAAAGIAAWHLPKRRGADVTGSWTLAALVLFVLLSAALVAPGRAQFGTNNAAQSRYVILVCTYWAALLVLLTPSGMMSRRLGKVAGWTLASLAAAALPAQLLVGLVWQAKAEHLRTAALVLATGVHDEEWAWRLHPLGMPEISPALSLFDGKSASFLAFPERGRERRSASSSLPICRGTLKAVDPTLGGEKSDGLRIEGRTSERGDRLVIFDARSHARGLAYGAPAVSTGRAFANEIVWGVVTTLTRAANAQEAAWRGFSGRGDGPPYVAQLMKDETPVCQAPVECCLAPTRFEYPPLIVGAGVREGALDAATCEAVAGWAWDAHYPNEPVEVRISANGRSFTVKASEFRSDLQAAGRGNGHHAFLASTAPLGLTAGAWEIEATFADADQLLLGSPRRVTCGS